MNIEDEYFKKLVTSHLLYRLIHITHTHTHIHTQAHTHTLYTTHTHIHTHKHTHMHSHVHTHTHTHTVTHTLTHTHSHTHTQTHTLKYLCTHPPTSVYFVSLRFICLFKNRDCKAVGDFERDKNDQAESH